MCIGNDRSGTGRNIGQGIVAGGRRIAGLCVNDGHFFHFALSFRSNDGNILSRRIKGRPNFGLFFFCGQCFVHFQQGHEIINFNAKGLLSCLDFTVQQGNVRLKWRAMSE
jgi:hypothetical protein